MPFKPTRLQLEALQTLELLQVQSVELLSPKWVPTGRVFRFLYGVPEFVLCAALDSKKNTLRRALPHLTSRNLIENQRQPVAWMAEQLLQFRGIGGHGVAARWTIVDGEEMLISLAAQQGLSVKRPSETQRKKSRKASSTPSWVVEQIQGFKAVGSRMRPCDTWERIHTTRQVLYIQITSKGLDLLDELDAKWVPDVLVTLAQMAPLVGFCKRTLERWLSKEMLPLPDVRGGGGQAHRWYWRTIRTELERHSCRRLPVNFPGSHIIS
ncbi:MAG TPA: hypothetical protein PK093_09890 [Phycisphaerae bacterium]|nr:hypothetical protein [Phycisphaerae bacterium]